MLSPNIAYAAECRYNRPAPEFIRCEECGAPVEVFNGNEYFCEDHIDYCTCCGEHVPATIRGKDGGTYCVECQKSENWDDQNERGLILGIFAEREEEDAEAEYTATSIPD